MTRTSCLPAFLLIILPFISTGQGLNLQWAQSSGGSGSDFAFEVVTDASNNVYTYGQFEGTVDFDPGAGVFNMTAAGSSDLYIQKLDASGNFVWAKQLTGPDSQDYQEITIDATGNVIVSGNYFTSMDADPGPGTVTLTTLGSFDGFIIKLDNNGNFIWAKTIVGVSGQRIEGHHTDSNGNVYTTGYYGGTTDFDPNAGTANKTAVGNLDAFVCKWDASGNFIWVRTFDATTPGSGNNSGTQVETDASGNVLVVGYLETTTDIDPGAGVVTLNTGISDQGFLVKLNASGDYIWGFEIGNFEYDYIYEVETDASSNIYIAGISSGTVDFDPGPGTTNLSFSVDGMFSAKYDLNGNFIWVEGIGDMNYSQVRCLHVDNAGGVYLSGAFMGTNIDFNYGTGTQLLSAGGIRSFVKKLDQNGTFYWVFSNQGTSSNNATGITTDTNNDILISGFFGGTCDFDPGAGTSYFTAVNSDAFVQKLSQCDPTFGTDVVFACGPYTWLDGITYTNNNTTAQHTLPGAAVGGCDSIVTLNLTINSPTSSSEMATACGSYAWNGSTYSATGTYTWTGTNAAGCDSVVTLNLTILPTSSTTETASACYNYSWNGNTYNSTGMYTWTGTNAVGCDSVVTLDLTIYDSVVQTSNQTACDSYSWQGNTYNSSGMYTWTGTTSNGCDSIVHLNLTINSSSTSTTNTSACAPYVWNGTSYATTGVYTYLTTNAAGCDSVATLNLTILPQTTSTTNVDACVSYDWNGNTYNSSGTYTWTGTNANGCDSIATLNLTIHQPTTGNEMMETCNSYFWPITGQTYTQPGQYTGTTTNAAGCDSVITLDLMLFTTTVGVNVSEFTLICDYPAQQYQWLDCDNNFAPISGATNMEYTATANGNYAVQIIDGNCVDTSACVAITTIGVDELELQSVNVYPNPTSGIVKVDFGTLHPTRVQVLDLHGKILFETNPNEQEQLTLNLQSYENGLYLIRTEFVDGEKIVRVILN